MALVGGVAWEVEETILLASRTLGWETWVGRPSFTLPGQITGVYQSSRTQRNKRVIRRNSLRAQFQLNLVTASFLAN